MTTRVRRPLAVLALLAAGAAAAACGDSSGPDEPPIAGSYQLVQINGQVLPYTYATCGFDICQVREGKIVVRSRSRLLDIKQAQRVSGSSASPLEPDTQAVAFSSSGQRVLIRRAMPLASDSYVDTLRVESKGQVLTVRVRRLFRSDPGGPYTLSYLKQ